MNRQESLTVIWRKLLLIFIMLIALSVGLSLRTGPFTVPELVFITGNIGGYVGIHRNLNSLSDVEIMQLSSSWLGLIVPSFIGGILACVLYLLFISGIISGELFPKIVEDSVDPGVSPPRVLRLFFTNMLMGYLSMPNFYSGHSWQVLIKNTWLILLNQPKAGRSEN